MGEITHAYSHSTPWRLRQEDLKFKASPDESNTTFISKAIIQHFFRNKTRRQDPNTSHKEHHTNEKRSRKGE